MSPRPCSPPSPLYTFHRSHFTTPSASLTKQFAQFLTVKAAVGWRLQHENVPPHIPTFLAPCSKLYGRPPSLIYSNALTTTTALRSPCAAIFGTELILPNSSGPPCLVIISVYWLKAALLNRFLFTNSLIVILRGTFYERTF